MLSLWNQIPTPSVLDRVFDDVMRSAFGTHGAALSTEAFQPRMDVRSDEDALVFECDVPGVRREDLDVSIEDHVLTIKGSRSFAASDKKQEILIGRSYGSFSASYALPAWASAEHVTSELANGVLTVRIPKPAQAKPRKILIGGDGTKPALTSG